MASELRLVEVVADGRDTSAIADAVELLEHLERRWSRFLPTSDITRLNNAGGAPVEVDHHTITLVATMLDGWHSTAGAFDPSQLPALCAAGYDRSIDDAHRVTLLPDGSMHVAGHDTWPSLDDVEIDVTGSTIRLPAGVALDPGGIGKGLAADLAVALLTDRGALGALVSIGGDLVATGRAPDDADDWVIAVENPVHGDTPACTLGLPAGGVATSSTRSRRWQTADGEHHHLIDPATGTPSSTDLATVTVIARSGWLAEVHATAALLAGTQAAIDHLDRHDLSGLAIALDGSVSATTDLHLLTTENAR